MRLIRAILVIADISGYTDFIRYRAVSLVHAEEIVSELLEAVIDHARFPLAINKFEGDAVLMFAETKSDDATATFDVLAQIADFFAAFGERLRAIGAARRHCACDACTRIDTLRLKVFVHVGESALKRIRDFEELAGEDVILIHRLLKNGVPEREYLLLTSACHALVGERLADGRRHEEELEGLGRQTVWVHPVAALAALHRTPPYGDSAAAEAQASSQRMASRRSNQVPPPRPNPFRLLTERIVLSLLALRRH